FFQAEDGIRDFHVTGVQTCALPISSSRVKKMRRPGTTRASLKRKARSQMALVLEQSFPLGRFHATRWNQNPFEDPYGEWPPSPRSEERRVGTEGSRRRAR